MLSRCQFLVVECVRIRILQWWARWAPCSKTKTKSKLEQIAVGTKIRTGFTVLNQALTQFCSSVPSKIKIVSGKRKKFRSLRPLCKCHWRILNLIPRNQKSDHPPKTAGTLEHPIYIYIYNNNIISKNNNLEHRKTLFQVPFVKFTPSERWNTFIINDLHRYLPCFCPTSAEKHTKNKSRHLLKIITQTPFICKVFGIICMWAGRAVNTPSTR